MRIALVACLLIACGGGGAPATPAGPALESRIWADDAVAAFATLEERLAGAAVVEIEGESTSRGLIESQARGALKVERERVTIVHVQGTLMGAAFERHWSSMRPYDVTQRDTQPPTWADALLIGFSRMGLLHNWARLSGERDPD